MEIRITIPNKTTVQDAHSIKIKFKKCFEQLSQSYELKDSRYIIGTEHAKKYLKSFFKVKVTTVFSQINNTFEEELLDALFSTCYDTAIGFTPEGENFAKITVVIIGNENILEKSKLIDFEKEADEFHKKQRGQYMFT